MARIDRDEAFGALEMLAEDITTGGIVEELDLGFTQLKELGGAA